MLWLLQFDLWMQRTEHRWTLAVAAFSSECLYSGNDTGTNVAIAVITQVGKQLLDSHAVLLSQVYDDFIRQLHNKGFLLVPSKRWLLPEIVTRLSPHVEMCCKIQKLGTMLYRSGGGILYDLSHALDQAKRNTCTMFHTAYVLNKHVQDTAARFISYYRGNPDFFCNYILFL